jgi:hypothetical protein
LFASLRPRCPKVFFQVSISLIATTSSPIRVIFLSFQGTIWHHQREPGQVIIIISGSTWRTYLPTVLSHSGTIATCEQLQANTRAIIQLAAIFKQEGISDNHFLIRTCEKSRGTCASPTAFGQETRKRLIQPRTQKATSRGMTICCPNFSCMALSSEPCDQGTQATDHRSTPDKTKSEPPELIDLNCQVPRIAGQGAIRRFVQNPREFYN